MRKLSVFLFVFLLCYMFAAAVSACPACAENLAQDTVNAGMSKGIGLTIFFFLGIFGSVVGLVTWAMIKEGKKSQLRHEQLAAQQASSNA